MERFVSFLTFVTLALGVVVSATFFGTFAYYDLMPMRVWMKYRGAAPIWDARGQEIFVRVNRSVYSNSIFVMRLAELQEEQRFGIVQHCQWASYPPTEDHEAMPYDVSIMDIIGPLCNLDRLEGREVRIQLTFDLGLPFNIHKRCSFLLGPFVVRQGKLHISYPLTWVKHLG